VGAFAMAIGLSEGTTVLLKLWIQRPRPNFYSLCGFDKSLLKCTADLHHLREANFSFPSGHSSLSCCGMTFLVWYLLGNNQNTKRPMVHALNAILPWGWTIFVAASRIADSWHHPSDVLAGLALGFVICTIAYHTWYPPVWSKFAGIPRALNRMDTDDNNNKLPSFSE
jgi:diacylglycerol diphosphate phosphatase/phosphatidate phosphatase